MISRPHCEVQRLSLDKLRISGANPRILQQCLLYSWHFKFAKKQATEVFEVSSIVLWQELLENILCSNRDFKRLLTSEVHCINVRDLVNSVEIWDLRVVVPSVRSDCMTTDNSLTLLCILVLLTWRALLNKDDFLGNTSD